MRQRIDNFYRGADFDFSRNDFVFDSPVQSYQAPIPKKIVFDEESPSSFKEYIGQAGAKDLAQIMVGAALKQRRSLPNIMIVGEYGLGKTSLARIIMDTMGLPDRLYDGDSVNKEPPENGTFIIDEIHNVNPSVADSLNLLLDKGTHHIIGCTNKPGMLPSAFRSRFRTLQLNPYTLIDLQVILNKVIKRKGLQTEKGAIRLLAERSRFNARQAIQHLSMTLDMMAVKNQRTINETVINSMFKKVGVDSKGLLPRDRNYLQALRKDRPVGLQYLSAVLGMDKSTIEEEVEPYLLRLGLIDRGPRGRMSLE